jgi:hypothetical protein
MAMVFHYDNDTIARGRGGRGGWGEEERKDREKEDRNICERRMEKSNPHGLFVEIRSRPASLPHLSLVLSSHCVAGRH